MNEIYYIIIGAVLAIIGGAVSDIIHEWLERGRERKAIQVVLADELGEVETTIKNMHEVWEQTKFFGAKYVADLLSSTQAYDSVRSRLFIIKDEKCRKRVVAFYKKLKDTAKKSEGKVGTLADTDEAKAEQTAFEKSFQELGNEARQIKEDFES